MRGAHSAGWDNGAVNGGRSEAMQSPRNGARNDGRRPGGTRTVVHLLRHGKVENPRGVLYGRLPGYHLSEVGRAMADGIAAHLAGADITYLACSPLERARETAAPLAALLGLVPDIDSRLIEAGSEFEGEKVSLRGGVLRDPRSWPALRNPLTPSWGEPYLDIAHRMLGALYSAVGAAHGHQAVLVSHQLPIWTTRRFITGQRLWHNPVRRECALASLTSLTFLDGVFVGLEYTDPVGRLASDDDPVGAGA
jgi:broad specificity phosphatase PhoE